MSEVTVSAKDKKKDKTDREKRSQIEKRGLRTGQVQTKKKKRSRRRQESR
jgi:hypothetical protein